MEILLSFTSLNDKKCSKKKEIKIWKAQMYQKKRRGK